MHPSTFSVNKIMFVAIQKYKIVCQDDYLRFLNCYINTFISA